MEMLISNYMSEWHSLFNDMSDSFVEVDLVIKCLFVVKFILNVYTYIYGHASPQRSRLLNTSPVAECGVHVKILNTETVFHLQCQFQLMAPEHYGKVTCVSELRWELVLVTMTWRVQLPAHQVTFAQASLGLYGTQVCGPGGPFENPGWEPPGLDWSIWR